MQHTLSCSQNLELLQTHTRTFFLENCFDLPLKPYSDIEGLNERLKVQLRGVWHISLPNSFSKVSKRSKIKLPLQKNLLLSLDQAMMVELIGLIL